MFKIEDIEAISFCSPLKGISKNEMLMADLKDGSYSPVMYFVKPKNITQEVFNEILRQLKFKLGVKFQSSLPLA